MHKHLLSGVLLGTATAMAPLTAPADDTTTAVTSNPAAATSWWSEHVGQNLSVGGFIRSETAFSTSNGKLNPFNQGGNAYNGVPTARNGLYPDTTTRSGVTQTQVINTQLFRTEVESKLRLPHGFTVAARVRGVFDPAWYSEYDPNLVNTQAAGRLNYRPDYFQYNVEGAARGQPLEWSGRQYLIDLPALVLEYSTGPLSLRAGVQQIAWGQAIFFRVLDVPNGLDFRRHSVLDFASEEFSDKRVAAPALRMTYSFDSGWVADGYVQKFQPGVYSNPNTPYNVIASQFTVHDMYANYDNKLDAGIRFKGDVGGLGLQAIYARRYNSEGVFRWTASGVNRDIPGLVGSGAAMQGTPLEVDSTGVWSATEWFDYAGLARLNGVSALNAIVNEFQPFTGALGAMPVTDYNGAAQTLDTFFQLAGGALLGENNAGLRGHIAREYRREDDIGIGASHVFDGEPGSFMEQLIVNFEALYVPNRTFTDPSLRQAFLRKKEVTAALVVEKYHRFSTRFPATYFVAQGIYKSHSDLFGRYIGGMGGSAQHESRGFGGGYKAVALALQQPFPNLVWRADLAMLYDVQGGVFIQPTLRWKPNGAITIDAFYNYLNGHLGNQNQNIVGTLDFADEVGLRLAYQF